MPSGWEWREGAHCDRRGSGTLSHMASVSCTCPSAEMTSSCFSIRDLRQLFSKDRQSSSALVFQKEVANRIIAFSNTKDYGRISILSSWKLNIKKIRDIYPSSFYPKPKVESTILFFEPKDKYFKINNVKNLEFITNTFFNQRRKMIKKPLKFLFENFEKVSKDLSLDLNLRPQNLDNVTYYKICSYYEKLLK